MNLPEKYWVNRRFVLCQEEIRYPRIDYAIYSFPGGGVRDSISHPDPQKAYALAWARFCELQREAWDDHDQQLSLF